MRVNDVAKTPFDEGKKAVKLALDTKNPYAEGSIEHRNYELGRQFGLHHLKAGDRFRTPAC